MLTQTLHCPHCGSDHLVSNGHAKNGKRRFQCQGCKKYGRQDPRGNGYDEQAKATILAAYHERPSIQGLRRVFGVSRNTVAAWLKESLASAAPGADPGAAPAGRAPGDGRTLVVRGPA